MWLLSNHVLRHGICGNHKRQAPDTRHILEPGKLSLKLRHDPRVTWDKLTVSLRCQPVFLVIIENWPQSERGFGRIIMDLMIADLKYWDKDEDGDNDTMTMTLVIIRLSLMRVWRQDTSAFSGKGRLPGRIIPNLTRGESYNDLATKWLIVKILPRLGPCVVFQAVSRPWPLSGTSSHSRIYIPGMPRPGPGCPAARPGLRNARAGREMECWVSYQSTPDWDRRYIVTPYYHQTASVMGKFSLARLVMCAKYERLTSEDYIRLGLCLPDNCQDCAQGHGHYVKNDKMVSRDEVKIIVKSCPNSLSQFKNSFWKMSKSSWKLTEVFWTRQRKWNYFIGPETGLFSQLQIWAMAMCWNLDKILKL